MNQETKTELDEKSYGYNEDSLQDVLKRADELQDDYHNNDSEISGEDKLPNIPIGAWITGVSWGEVIDIELDEKNDELILDVRMDNDEIEEVRVRDRNTEYTDKNELVRVLEYVDIDEGRIEKLLGKKIPIYVDRYALPSNDWAEVVWRPYVPDKLDKVGKIKHKSDLYLRYLGYEGEFQSKSVAIAFLFVALFWWGISFAMVTTGVVSMAGVTASFGISLTIITIFSLLMTIYTPLILRFGRLLWEKYLERRKKSSA